MHANIPLRLLYRQFHSSVRVNKIVPFLLADIGEGIREVEIIRWFIKEGQDVQQFDKIAEVQSDKATVEITSRYAGRIKKVHYREADTAKVGEPLIDIEVEGKVMSESKPKPKVVDLPSEKSSEARISMTSAKSSDTLVNTLPAVRQHAKEHGIDLTNIKGTGKDGRILVEDLTKHSSVKKGDSYETSQAVPLASALSPGVHAVPLKPFQKAMVQSMQEALKVPHLGYMDEVDMSSLYRLHGRLAAGVLAERGIKLTYMAYFIKALSMALHEYPIVNSRLDIEKMQVLYHDDHNIGIAVDSPHGLAVPVLKKVQAMSVLKIAAELKSLVEKATSNRLSQGDIAGGTITISNIGTIGGTYASPILVVPQVCIGAVGRVQTLPRYDEVGNLVERHVMNISWAADHRVVDGATIARFSNRWKAFCEDPNLFIVD